jgi:RNA polymerase sigma-70 factor (ECF subfamily)
VERLTAVSGAVLTVGTAPDEGDLLAATLAGDEDAFGQFVDRHYPAMLHVARGFVRTAGAAEEVVHETLLAVVEGLPRFERRSSLQTWMFRILVNRAKTRGASERRRVSIGRLRADRDDYGDDSARLRSNAASVTTPSSTVDPAAGVLNRELREAIWDAVDGLPAHQRPVLVLRDMQGWTSVQVCEVLGLSEANQRILLHRARTKVRAQLLRYLN